MAARRGLRPGGGSGAGGLQLPLVDVLQGGGDGPHVQLDAARPVLHVADLLERLVEVLHHADPLARLLGELGSLDLQRLHLMVQLPLVHVGLGHPDVQVIRQGLGQARGCSNGLSPSPLLLLPALALPGLVLAQQPGQHHRAAPRRASEGAGRGGGDGVAAARADWPLLPSMRPGRPVWSVPGALGHGANLVPLGPRQPREACA